MANGSVIPITDMFGGPMYQGLSPIQRMDIGSTRTMAGPGFRITPGVGHPSIMAGGTIGLLLAGCGSRIMNGALHGCTGEALRGITDGLPWDMETIMTITVITIAGDL